VAKKQLPMMPWFPQSFAASTRGWTILERAIYREMLDAQWEMGRLPSNPVAIALAIGANPGEFEIGFSKCASKFVEKNGELFNERLEQHRRKAKKLSTLRAKIGSSGGKARALANARPKGKQLVNHLSSSSDSEDLRSSAARPLNGHSPSDDPRKSLWDLGVNLLGTDARSVIGQAIKRVGESKVGEILGQMSVRPPAEPKSWFIKATQERGVVC
jgi:hypothetical protein